MFKEYRIRKLKEYISATDAEIETIRGLIKNVASVPRYYTNRLIEANKKKAVFESRLSNLNAKNDK